MIINVGQLGVPVPEARNDFRIFSEAPYCHPAYRVGYYVTKDENTNWPGKFDWKVTANNPRGMCMGWFGSLESAYTWMYKNKI